MDVKDLLKVGKENAITRYELSMLTGMPDRAVRSEIERLRREMVILNDQDGKGYYISTDPDEIARYYRQEAARAKSIFYRLKPCRAAIKKAPTGGNHVEANKKDCTFIKPQDRGKVK